MVITTIALPENLKKRLDKLKVHRREPYFDVIERLVKKEEDKDG